MSALTIAALAASLAAAIACTTSAETNLDWLQGRRPGCTRTR